jgi:hypothetical protein
MHEFWSALGAIATFFAVVVALFGDRIRYRLDPPRLRIFLKDPLGAAGELHFFNPDTNEATKTLGLWHHVQVKSETRWRAVTGVYVYLLSIEVPDASGDFQSIWEGASPLGWRHEPGQQPKKIGHPAECDLCHVLKDPLQMRLSPLIKGQIPDTITGQVKMLFTLQARGSEADSNVLRIEISWDGEWSDTRTEMRRHLVVKTLS